METLVYFKHCNLDGLDKSDIKLRFFRENSLICCADDMPRKMYIIRQGAAKVYRQVNDYEFIVAGVLRIVFDKMNSQLQLPKLLLGILISALIKTTIKGLVMGLVLICRRETKATCSWYQPVVR